MRSLRVPVFHVDLQGNGHLITKVCQRVEIAWREFLLASAVEAHKTGVGGATYGVFIGY